MAFSAFEVSQTVAAQFGGCHDFSGSDDTPLHTAAYEGNVAVLRDNLNKRASREAIDQRNHLGCTSLRLAATGGHTDCVALLMSHGCSIDIPDVKGQTPLHVAVKNLHLKCAELLLERGANPNGHSHNRTTPLCIAAMQGSLDMVQLLLSFKAEIVVRRQSANGLYFTVDSLQLAAAYQHYDCLKALLAAGGQMVTLKSFTGVATSPYHTLVLQSCGWRYAELLYEFGFTAWVKDSRGRFPWETEPRGGGRDSASCQQLMEFFERVKAEPRPLKSWCRLSVWRHMLSMKRDASALKCLPALPQSVVQYLTFEQL